RISNCCFLQEFVRQHDEKKLVSQCNGLVHLDFDGGLPVIIIYRSIAYQKLIESRFYTSWHKGSRRLNLSEKVVAIPLEHEADKTTRTIDLRFQRKLSQIARLEFRIETIAYYRTCIVRKNSIHGLGNCSRLKDETNRT